MYKNAKGSPKSTLSYRFTKKLKLNELMTKGIKTLLEYSTLIAGNNTKY